MGKLKGRLPSSFARPLFSPGGTGVIGARRPRAPACGHGIQSCALHISGQGATPAILIGRQSLSGTPHGAGTVLFGLRSRVFGCFSGGLARRAPRVCFPRRRWCEGPRCFPGVVSAVRLRGGGRQAKPGSSPDGPFAAPSLAIRLQSTLRTQPMLAPTLTWARLVICPLSHSPVR